MPGDEHAPLRTALPCSGADVARARACEATVFHRAYGDAPQALAAAFDASTRCGGFGVVAAGSTVLGAVRVGWGGVASRTLQDVCGEPWHAELPPQLARDAGPGAPDGVVWDVLTFGVDAVACRQRGVAAGAAKVALLGAVFAGMRARGARWLVAVLDVRARRTFAAAGVVVHDVPGTRPVPYLGSPASVPVLRRFDDLHDEHLRRAPQLHPAVFHADGGGCPGSSVDLRAADRATTSAG